MFISTHIDFLIQIINFYALNTPSLTIKNLQNLLQLIL